MARMVITGNRLRDGAVVWRGPDGAWVRDIAEAAVHATGETLAQGLDAARLEEASGRIIGVYEVETQDGRAQPVRLRERIRADGPTVAAA